MDILQNLKFSDIQVIGQSADLAVIFCFHIEKRRIICVDQHAAHERIRYERLLRILKLKMDEGAIKSKACHGAIRIGCQLSLKQCQNLIKRLLFCKVPFRCAHFRCGVGVLESIDKIIMLEKIREEMEDSEENKYTDTTE